MSSGYIVDYQDGSHYIECKHCGLRSFNPNDIRERYCGKCHVFHDEQLPRSGDFGAEPDFRDPDVPLGTWQRVAYGWVACWEIRTEDARITLEPRPVYYDRGRWTAHVEVRRGLEHPHRLTIEAVDFWPRLYFDLERAKLECEAWLRSREQLP